MFVAAVKCSHTWSNKVQKGEEKTERRRHTYLQWPAVITQ